jgi:NAD(P)-dependent dehydrogenase (short-subunit alcohol dehydrogenase family)
VASWAARTAATRADRFDDLVATNLNGTLLLPRALDHPGPEPRHIVVCPRSSPASRCRITPAGASKAGSSASCAFAAELAPRRIQVNAICPGWVDTDMAWQGLDAFDGLTRAEAFDVAMQEVPLRRMSQPAESAATVAWLLSPDALGVTGQAIDHNNGAFMI